MKMHSPGHSSADSMVMSSWPPGTLGDTIGALGVSLGVGVDGGAIPDVGQTVVEQDENVWGDLLAQTVACAEILIDPHLHGLFLLVTTP